MNLLTQFPIIAFVVFEIAKGFDYYRIEKDTRLLAGKDKKNVELTYKTDKDIVVTKARVSSLRRFQSGQRMN